MRIPNNKRFTFTIEPKDVDLKGRATMSSVFDYMMRTAHLHAQRYKLGMYDIREQNLSWVIVRAVVEMETVLKADDTFSIVTWVSECNRLSCVRNFIILNAEEKEIGHAVTQWCIIDHLTRKPVNLLEMPRIIRHMHPEYPTCGLYPKRIQPLTEYDKRLPHHVVYSDLDFNGHVNSLKYLQWMLDQLSIDWASGRQLWHFDVNYVHEILLGEQPYILYKQGEDFTAFEICKDDGSVACRAEMQWREFED